MDLRGCLEFWGCAALGFGLVVGPVVAALLGVVWMLWPRQVPVPRPVRPPAYYAVRGIDVSHHQGQIDWSAVAASGEVDFAFVKATEGVSHRDRRFERNWKGAHKAGIPVGAYHYLSLCRGGADQARHFAARVPRDPDALPPVVDIEPDARCNRGSRLGRAGAEVAAWIGVVEKHYGRRPIVYTSASFWRSHLAGEGLRADLWAAAYSREPRVGTGPWLFWQYTDRGWVSGIAGPVDQNVFAGSLEDLAGLRSGVGAITPPRRTVW